ncbi:hypothetical protein IGI04_011124 [Brassica rapa subsp. trilocularis]|uniref:Uncharacterized protein n=1 Tax=Brassica rapa subsp. trilocularis TaxID=1813537 RepID=A0ABQ7N252_BRACM|nr:hypothetical protein IGI04_011124 [Brassica rapa subsp. trilocularis]
MIWMLITARRGQHDLDADYRHKRTALPPNSLFNSSILDNFSPRLELLVSDAVKRQMTKDDEKHQKMMTWYWSVRFQPDVTISWRDYFIRGRRATCAAYRW